ncbi:MAG: DUF58 domain-containing protein [Halobacteriovoraceae bacterium]|nr:DUF58 domain-containing protein [Halobacteriovoraceae bacterium]
MKRFRLSPFNAFQKKFKKLTRRHDKIFIIPNRYGIYFLTIIFILFLISLSYGHSLAFTTTFVFVSLVMTSAHYTNFNLSGLEVVALHPPLDLYSGMKGELRVTLKNNKKKTRFDLLAEVGKKGISKPVTLERGEYLIERITLSSAFPFGLFMAWKYWYLDSHFIVFPKIPEETPILPKAQSFQQSRGAHKGKEEVGSEEFFGHIEYQEGMPLRSIDWKAYSRGKGILLKQFVEENDLQFTFSLDELKGELEERISSLTGWIEEAEKLGVSYSVNLEGRKTAFGRGRAFKRQCLKMVSQFKNEKKVLA